MEPVTLETSFHNLSYSMRDFQSCLLCPWSTTWKLSWETDFGTFWAECLNEDHQGSFHANRPPPGTYPPPRSILITLLRQFPFGISHSISFLFPIRSYVDQSFVSNISFNLSLQLEAPQMLHEKKKRKTIEGFSFKFLREIQVWSVSRFFDSLIRVWRADGSNGSKVA